MMKLRIHWQQPIWWVSGGALALGLVLVVLLLAFYPRSPIPQQFRKQANFALLYPGAKGAYKVDANSFSYQPDAKVLIFHAKNDSNDLTVSEQATPDPFNDIPEYYTKLMQRLNDYKDFDSINGNVSLTRPQELQGGQSAVFNGKGTLMFAHPAHDMSDDDWRQFFNSLVLEQ